MPPTRDLLDVLRDIQARLDGNVSLETLAARAGWSQFHLHRSLSRLLGETPKQYTQRLRLERAAARLASTPDPIVDVALAAGFASHEVFTRAFRRQFGTSPSDYRVTALAGTSAAVRERHRVLTEQVGPCVSLYRVSLDRRSPMPAPTVIRQELTAQPFLFIRRRTAAHELAATLAECFGKVFGYCHQAGLALSGRPTTRYVESSPGMWTIEAGKPLDSPAPGEGEIECGLLPGGPAAMAVHHGPYDRLGETHAAIERWIEANGMRAGGAPWEVYITDPAEHPDPSTWRTDVYWPLAE